MIAWLKKHDRALLKERLNMRIKIGRGVGHGAYIGSHARKTHSPASLRATRSMRCAFAIDSFLESGEDLSKRVIEE